MIIGKEDKERDQYQRGLAQRFYEAHRWLSEFDDIFGPMWDYVMGKAKCIPQPNGEHIHMSKYGEPSLMREHLRNNIHQAIDKRAREREKEVEKNPGPEKPQ